MFGWLAANCSSFVGLAASGGLAATASSISRKSSPEETGKNLSELINYVGFVAAGEMKLDGHSVRISQRRAIRPDWEPPSNPKSARLPEWKCR